MAGLFRHSSCTERASVYLRQFNDVALAVFRFELLISK